MVAALGVTKRRARRSESAGTGAWPVRDHLQGSISANAINRSVGARSCNR